MNPRCNAGRVCSRKESAFRTVVGKMAQLSARPVRSFLARRDNFEKIAP
jgi:hypothetical protein